LKDYKGQVEQLFNALTAVKEANKNLFECKIKTTAAVGAFCDAFGSVSKVRPALSTAQMHEVNRRILFTLFILVPSAEGGATMR